MQLAALVLLLVSALPARSIRPALGWAASWSCADGPLEEAERLLREPNKRSRMGALQKLARIDTAESWSLVLDALEDRNGEVAATAQLVLGRSTSPWVHEALTGKKGLLSSSAGVARRAAEALGRLPRPVAAGHLVRALGRRDDELRRTCLWTLERAARAGRLTDAEGARSTVARLARRSSDPTVRARALAAAVALQLPESAALVGDGARDRRPALRTASCALSLEALGPADAEPLLLEALNDPAWSVRLAAIDGLADCASPRGARALAARMPRETRPSVLRRLQGRLSRLSGLRHGMDARPWIAWAEALPSTWSPAAAEDEPRVGPATVRGTDQRTVSFAGLSILSDHLAVLIDLSGSMWARDANGRTRKEVVDRELRRAFEALPREARFLLIPYTGEPHPFDDRLLPATRAHVQRALAFFERTKRQGTGDFWEAAMLALEEEEVDTLLVLTDGVPTGGEHDPLDLLMPLFREHNLSRQITLDVALVGAPSRVRSRWEDLCRSTGGRVVVFDTESAEPGG